MRLLDVPARGAFRYASFPVEITSFPSDDCNEKKMCPFLLAKKQFLSHPIANA
jgi:hypothetical protein